MIQFQQTFTNAEQSKRLLELGVPADSADIALIDTPDSPYDPYIIGGDMTLRQRLREGQGLPSWSIGRLMEIYDTCDAEYMHKGWDTYFDLTIDYIEYVVMMFEFDIPKGKIDLSRLEE